MTQTRTQVGSQQSYQTILHSVIMTRRRSNGADIGVATVRQHRCRYVVPTPTISYASVHMILKMVLLEPSAN